MNKKLINILLFLLVSSVLYAQDTSKVTGPNDTAGVSIDSDSLRVIKPQDTARVPPPFIADFKYQFLNPINPDTVSRSRMLWLPLKIFEDVFNYLPGYFLNYMDIGQVNRLNYNQLDNHYSSLLRHGRPLNDLFDGSIDFNLLSRNEISALEITNGHGNSPYNYANNINVIQRQLFRFTPYSEISFWQDRYENVFFDGNFHVNFSRKINFNFGITKHTYDGRYVNSDFDKWLGRFNFNYIGSNKFNAFLYLNYSRIQRGLNEGLDPLKLVLFDRDNLYSISADVINPDAYEIRERFDIDAGGIWAYGKDKSSFTKFQIFTSNSFRKYRDEENRGQFQPTNGLIIKENTHWINYGAKVVQNFVLPVTNKTNIGSKTTIEADLDIIFANTAYYNNTSSNRQYLLEELEINYNRLKLNGFFKYSKYAYISDKFYPGYGAGLQYDLFSDSLNKMSLFGNYSFYNRLPGYGEFYPSWGDIEKVHTIQSGLDYKFQFGNVKAEYYLNRRLANRLKTAINSTTYSNTSYYNTSGVNGKIFLKLWKFEIEAVHQFNLLPEEGTAFSVDNFYYPKHSGNVMLSYHSKHFKDKLEVKIGLNSRYWTSFVAPIYSGQANEFYLKYYYYANEAYNTGVIGVNDNATLDFFITGKITKAMFGLYFENIINKASVTTGIYPNQQRGGLANVMSRFNVTWYFLN